MHKVRQTRGGDWIVCESNDGSVIHGPFKDEMEAYAAMKGRTVKPAEEPAKRGPGRPPKKEAE